MSILGIQGHFLEVTVVGCNKLKDTEWICRQDPYVCLEYGSTKFRTTTCTDGGRNPTFQEKFVITLIEGLTELTVNVWNSNTLTYDDFIGNGKIQLQRVLSEGYDDSAWALQTKTGRYAGEIRLILHHTNDNKPTTSLVSSAPPYLTSSAPQQPLYPTIPPTLSTYAPLPTAYPGPPPYSAYPPPPSSYPPPTSPYVSNQGPTYPPPFYPHPPYPGSLAAYCCPPPPGCYPRQYAPPPY